jgi:hypothetical protein
MMFARGWRLFVISRELCPMSSITFWARLEPDPRSAAIEKSLAAPIRDPVWMLARQWQVGEFLGEDAASPAYVKLIARQAPFLKWRVKQAPLSEEQPLAGPLEPLIEREPFSASDLSIRVELGQTFESLLRQRLPDDSPEVIEIIRLVYPVRSEPDEKDQAVERFLSICARRATDGANLYLDAKAIIPQPPAKLPPLLESNPDIQPFKAQVIQSLIDLMEWVEDVYGVLSAPGQVTPSAWLPERLEYGIEVVAGAPQGGQITLSADPGRDGELDWRAFDLQSQSPSGGSPDPSTFCVLPIHVQFNGMPNHRWWDFEDGAVNLSAITPDKTDLAKLVVADFMLIHGNDWFVIPYQLDVGSLCRIDSLLVRDVFGGLTLVERADRPFIQLGERWSMFSTTASGNETGLADFLVLPPSVFTAKQTGPTLEEICFVRDEMANMAWAIERTIENKIGEPQPGFERDVAAGSAAPPTPDAGESSPPLRYQIQTTTPVNWIPLIPVRIDRETGDIALELGAMLDQDNNAIAPRGRILTPSVSPYRIREEEVPRSGARVRRSVNRARWIDGSTFLWIAREKSAGMGEGNSGLQFDLAIPNR